MPGTVKTRSGRTLSEADVDRLAAELEKGLDLSMWKPRHGRPPLDAGAVTHAPRIAVRVPSDVHRRVVARATREGRSISEVVRDLLEGYAGGPATPKI
jgi:predicted HicB family RNase H-like nuclease